MAFEVVARMKPWVLLFCSIGLAQPLPPALPAKAIVQPAPQRFALYTLDADGYATNRQAATNYSAALPTVAFRPMRVQVAKVATNGNESDYSPELAFVPTNNSALLAWSEPVFLSLFLQSGPPWTNRIAGPILTLTNPADAMEQFRLRISLTNAPP